MRAFTSLTLIFGMMFNGIAEESGSGGSSDKRKHEQSFAVLIDEVANGTFKVSPSIPESGRVVAGTVLSLEAIADPEFALDSVYSMVIGPKKWKVYRESMTSPIEVTVDQDMQIGASFVPESELKGFSVVQNVFYAQPGVKSLKYDAYVPDGAKSLPGIVIIHGGGWSANNEDVMRGLARELVRVGGYVVFSIDYRWIKNHDGDEVPNTMANLIEDVYGAIAHIQEHASGYGLEPTRLAVTGDSAGGHLSASAANMTGMIGDRGYGETEGVFEFLPTYLPEGKSVEEVREEISSAIQVAAPSYGVFGAGEMLKKMHSDKPEGWWRGIAPIETIPKASERKIPQLLLRGTKDWIKHENVQAYADALEEAGQRVKYVQMEGARHAFLDWKPDPKVQETFRNFGVIGAGEMKAFFDTVFYP